MGNNVKKRFTVSLDIETKDLEKQVKGTVSNLKTLLSDLGSASDKMGYFKDLVDYIGQIDTALTVLRTKNKDAFDHMFDGLDDNLKKEFEKIFGVAQDQLVVLDQLKDKLSVLKGSGTATGADLKPLEQEVKSLYESLGMLDKLDMSGKGKIETRIKKLEAALENFAVVFGDVNAKIGQGLNFGGNAGAKSNNIDNMVKDTNKQVDQLKQMKNTVKKAVNDFYKELTKINGASQSKLDSIKETLQKDLGFKDEEFFDLNDIFYDLEDAEIEADEAIKKINNIVTQLHNAKQNAIQTINTESTSVNQGVRQSVADAVVQEVNDTAAALNYGKQQLVKAWKEYYNAVQKAENDGLDLEIGEKSSEMSRIEDSVQDMLDAFGVKASNPSKWGIKTDLDLSEYIVDGDLELGDIEHEINELFKQHGVSFDASLQEMRAKMGSATADMSQEIVAAMDAAENKTNDILGSFQELVNYISQSGQKPGTLFDKLESGAKNVDEELKAILQSLNLIDSAGNMNFSSINSGFTNKGGFVSDQYTMIARKITGDWGQDYWGKSQKLQEKLASAQQAGAQVGAIFDLIKDEANGLFYEIQNTVSGTAAFSNDTGKINKDVLNASDDQLSQLVRTMQALSDNGLFIDFGGSNILYDKNKGFSIIDLGLVGGHGHTVSKQNTLQENIDRFIEEYTSFAPGNMKKDIQSVLADRLYDMAQNIDSSIVNKINPNKQKVQSQSTSQVVVSGLESEEAAHKQNADAIEAENAALKEQIDLKKKAQSMSWKDFATDLSLTGAKNAEGLYTLGDMEHYWKKANYDKDVDFHQITQSEIDAILAKRGYYTNSNGDLVDSKGKEAKFGATLDEVIRSSSAYGVAKKWYSVKQDFTAKNKMENKILEDTELRNIAMNKLYQLYKEATHDVVGFDEFLNKAIDVYRGDATQDGKGPAIFNPDEILAFSMQKHTAETFAHGNGTVVQTSINPKDTIGSLVTKELFDNEYEVQVPSHKFPEHDLYLNDKYQSFDDFYQQQNQKVQNGINKYLIQVEKNRVADLLGNDLTYNIDNISSSSSYLHNFKHGVVPNQIKKYSGLYESQVTDIYNNSDDMQKKLIAYYASLSSMDFGKFAKPKEIGMTGLIGALTNDPIGVKNHINSLTGEHQYNIFGPGAQDIVQGTKDYKKYVQTIKNKVQSQSQPNNETLNLSDVLQKVEDLVNSSYISGEGDKLNELWAQLSSIDYTQSIDPSVIKDGNYINALTGETLDLHEIGMTIESLEQAYGHNLEYVKNYLDQVIDQVFGSTDVIDTFDAKKLSDENLDVKGKVVDAYMYANGEHFDDIYQLYKYMQNIGKTINDASDVIPDGLVMDAKTGEIKQVSEIIELVNKLEQQYGDNFDYVKEHIQNVYGKLDFDQAANKLTTDLSENELVIEDFEPYDKAEISDKYNEAYDQLSDAYLATCEFEKEQAIVAIKDYINQVQKNVDNGNYDVLDNGMYLNDKMESSEYSDITDAILNYQNKYNENLTEVWDYLHTVFANHINSIENDLVVEIDDEPELNTSSIGQKYDDALNNIQSLIDNSVNGYLIDTLNTIKSHLDWVQFDVENNQDTINEGKYFNPSLDKLDYAELSDMVTDFEGIYGESLEQVHTYLKEVFKKQFDEVDTLLGINTGTAHMPGADVSKEVTNLNGLTAAVEEVELSVQSKTTAFEEEGAIVTKVVDKEVAALNELRVLLDDIQNALQIIFGNNNYNLGNLDLSQDKINDGVDLNILQNIQQTLGQILTVLQGFTGIKSDHENSLTYQEPVAKSVTGSYDELANKLVGDIATETTLSAIHTAIGQLSKYLDHKDDDSKLNQSLESMVHSLSDSVTVLNNAANGIVQHQKSQKSDTTVAMAKIQDPMKNQMMSGLAKSAVNTLGVDAEIDSMQALADGVVKIEGAFKNAQGMWEGFSVKINEHNQAVDLAVKKHSAFANMLNKSKDDDDNPYIYDKAEVEARAQKHLEEYAAQGKKATVQFKDSGRYTIAILEEIDGLTKQIFQTFDENDDKIERTTVTMSNNQKAKLDSLQKKLIDNGLSEGLISDQDAEYKVYQDASDELNKMTDLYSQLDNLSDAEVAKWKQQIALVSQLGARVQSLVKQRKLENDQKVFVSDRGKKLSKFDLDHATLQKDIDIPDIFTGRIGDARSAIENATDADSLKIAINNWEALQNEIKKTAVEQDLYFKKTTTKQPSPPSASKDQFTKDFTSQKTAFEKYKNDAMNAVGVTDDLKDKLNELEAELNSVSDADGLVAWQQSFSNLKTDISNAQKIFKSAKQASAAEIAGKANAKFKEVGFKDTDNNLNQEQEEIIQKRKELLQQIAEYNIKVSSGQDAEISGIQATRDELYKLIDAYKQKHNITGNTYGSKQLNAFGAKYNSLMTGAADVGLTSQNAAVKNLADAYQQLQAAQAAFNVGDNLNSEEGKQKVAAFLQAKQACNEYARELKKLVDAEKMLAADSVAFDPLEDNFDDTTSGRREALLNFMQSTYGASASVKKFEDDCNQLFFTVKNGDGTFTDMTATINTARTAIYATAGATKELSGGLKEFVGDVVSKFKSIVPYLTASFGWQEIWQQIRQGVTYVKEIDSALVELKKVTNETDATYSRFLQSMSKTAGVVGSTVSELTTMAADWAKLGYSIEEAGKLAESTAILLNVSEFQDATSASEALISTMQAFQYTADESQHVVDILNEVGNNYAVSSDGIATALQDSASALMEAGNSLEQSVALVAAANKVVQDPNSVGSALRTISLRLRGTSVEILEELGEETDGAVESVSKMQEKLKALTGVDILTDSGAYKDTYTILYDIAQVWDDMDKMDQAAALELMAGKNRANTLAAILNNIEDLKGAYESALNAEGSAMRENEAYLNSIQGRIDLFNNALQTFWMNLLNTDAIKGVIDAGTSLLKFADTFVGKLTLLAAAWATVKRVKDGVKFTEMIEGIVGLISGTTSLTAATLQQAIATQTCNKEFAEQIIVDLGLASSTGKLTKEQIKLAASTLATQYETGALTTSQYLAISSTMGLKTAIQALWKVLMSNPIFLVAASVALVGGAIDLFTTTVQEAANEAKEAFDEIKSIVDSTKSTIQSLESELSTLNEKINELDGKQLSFADNEELDRLKKQRAELEHSLKIQEQLLELQSGSQSKQAVASMEAYTKASSQGAEKTQKTWKTVLTTVGAIAGTIVGAVMTGGASLGVQAAAMAAGAAGFGLLGNKTGEYVGSKASENDGTYDSWYDTYDKAIETARAEEEKALEEYQSDWGNIKKLDKWREAQQKTMDIETEMYDHLSQMQQYYNDLEYGQSEETDKKLNEWYNFLDKLSIEKEVSGAEVTALDRIFGENASEEIQSIKEQMTDAVKTGKDFDFEAAINSSEELNNILKYVGLEAEDVKNYFTQVGEAAKLSSNVTPVKTYAVLVEGVENYNAILQQTSEIVADNTKVSQEYKDSLSALGISQEELNECFDGTNSLVVKDTKALNNLVKTASKNVATNVKLAKSQAKLKYYELYKEMKNLVNGTKVTDAATLDHINTLYSQMSVIQKTIAKYSLLEAQLLGTTNAYNKLADAQAADEAMDYGSKAEELVNVLANAFNTAELGTEAAQVAISGLVPDDVIDKAKALDEQMADIYKYFTKGTISKLFTIEFDNDGGISSVEMTKENVEAFTKSLIGSTEEGAIFQGTWDEFDLNPAINSLKEFADAIGATEEIAFAYLTSLEKYDISWLGGDTSTLLDQLMGDDLEYRIHDATQKLAELDYELAVGKISAEEYQKQMYGLNGELKAGLITQDEYKTRVSELKQQLDAGEISTREYNTALSGLNYAYDALGKYDVRPQVNAWIATTDQLQKAKDKLQEYYDILNSAELGDDGIYRNDTGEIVDVGKVQKDIDSVMAEINNLSAKLVSLEEPTKLTLQFASDSIQKDLDAIENQIGDIIEGTHYTFNIASGTYTVALNEGDPNYQKVVEFVNLLNQQHVINAQMGEDIPTVTDQLQSIADILNQIASLLEQKYSISVETSAALANTRTFKNVWDSISSKSITLTKNVQEIVSRIFNKDGEDSEVNGTAHVNGVAYKSGSWGAPETGTALVGELGPELLVRGNRWTTIGENGAEFTQVKKGDIIFNHKQTESLLKNGYVTGRGNLKGGSAFASGTAYAGINTWDDSYNKVNSDYKNSSSGGGNASDAAEDAAEEFRELFDWIATRLEEITERLDFKNARLENTVGYSNQNKVIDEMIELNEKLYDNLIAGANTYYEYAGSILSKIPSQYHQAVQDGTIAIETFVGQVDEETYAAIQDYRDWVQKGDNAVQQAEEVITEVSTLAKQAIDNIATGFDNENSIINNKIDQLEAYNTLAETRYGSESEKIYQNIIEDTNNIINAIQNQRDSMQAELNKQVEAGNIQKYSQDWYDAVNDIAALDTEIIELITDTYDYQDAINEIRWDHFDTLMEQYKMIADEAENLIDILGTKDVVNELGEWTNEGVTSLGLYAQQMENAEIQVKKYREEIDYLNKNWESMGLTQQEYIEKLDELKSGQYDSIKAYHDAKDAIVDLNKERVDAIKDGIEKEIEAYEELIKTKKKALEAEKDAVDFQRSIEESTKEISDIERQIAALSADNSATARSKRAKLEADLLKAQQDLQDKYYDRSIQDQQEALDKELESFQKEKDEEMEGWDKYLENTEQVVSDSLSVVQSNTSKIYETLKTLGLDYSLEITESLTSPWRYGEDAIQSYSEFFGLEMSATVNELQKVADEYKAIMDQIDEYGNAIVGKVESNTQTYQEAINPSTPKFDNPETVVTQPTPNNKYDVSYKSESSSSSSSGSSQSSASSGAISGLSAWLQQGSSGSSVRTLQQALNDLGFNAGTVDGIFGYNTKQAVIRFQNSSQYGGAIPADGMVGPETKKKFALAGYAGGTTGVKKDQLSIVDELGEELIMHADGSGRLAFLSKGSAVIPHDISENLMQLGELNPQDILDRNRPVVSAPHVTNNNIELNVSFGEVVHIDHVDNNAVPNLAKTVEKQIDKYMKGLNAEIRKYVR